jgi:transmembrane sensor
MNRDAPNNADVAQSGRRKARAEAAAWIVRLHGPHRTSDLEAGCRAWLAESDENAREFERVTDTWEAAASRSGAGLPRMARWKPMHDRHQWSMAAILMLVIGIAGTLGFKYWSVPSYATEVGGQRTVRLNDGSRVTMNSDTKICVSFTKSSRRVRLDRGEAFFEVAHNPARPFVVAAGDRQVTALGTAFEVSYDPERTAVTLVEGTVSVVAVGAAPPAPLLPQGERSTVGPGEFPDTGTIILSPGERVTYSRKNAPKVDEPKLETVAAWRHGEVVLDKTPLADAVAEMNRYETTRLVIEDPRTAALRVSGIYRAGESLGFAQTVAELYGLEVKQEGGEIRLRTK